MKICHLIFSLLTGGAETMLIDIINQQHKKEDVSLIIVNKLINESILEKLNKQIQVIKINRTPSSKDLFSIAKLNYIIFSMAPDVIHCHNVKLVGLLLPVFRKIAVLTLHDTNITHPELINKYKKTYVISEAVRNDLFNTHKLIGNLIYNGINFSALKEKKQLIPHAENSVFKMVQVGRLHHQKKGQHVLIEAMKNLIFEHDIKNIKLDFIGEGLSRDFLQSMVSKYKLDNYISFKGDLETRL